MAVSKVCRRSFGTFRFTSPDTVWSERSKLPARCPAGLGFVRHALHRTADPPYRPPDQSRRIGPGIRASSIWMTWPIAFNPSSSLRSFLSLEEPGKPESAKYSVRYPKRIALPENHRKPLVRIKTTELVELSTSPKPRDR